MNPNLAEWNDGPDTVAMETMIACCGARRWAEAMVALRPFSSIVELRTEADRVWNTIEEGDWMQAFASHPRIGEHKAAHASAISTAWSQQEQSSAVSASKQVMDDLAEGNRLYEERFGFTYIVCATGKNGEEMLAILNRRLTHDRSTELREAVEQQRQIMQIRLGKWLAS
ncbi:MAG TPA: 2-oxo-4-hydroxy-4-carboxy-5-ureidoimidazoline decarboxylase [Terracidiphilus sp.]|jgi:OHCU decarboxylase|nr:2-oxo-4-hydroxy-4-carboxy-5-ureidoimidazoline decarboxylase [Terracidiphilus sp.]